MLVDPFQHHVFLSGEGGEHPLAFPGVPVNQAGECGPTTLPNASAVISFQDDDDMSSELFGRHPGALEVLQDSPAQLHKANRTGLVGVIGVAAHAELLHRAQLARSS